MQVKYRKIYHMASNEAIPSYRVSAHIRFTTPIFFSFFFGERWLNGFFSLFFSFFEVLYLNRKNC